MNIVINYFKDMINTLNTYNLNKISSQSIKNSLLFSFSLLKMKERIFTVSKIV